MAPASEPESLPSIFIPEEWFEAVESIAYGPVTSPPPTAFVCGAKNSGKTTFSRHLINVLLRRYKKVAYLDTDVGQAEFTPPGCLSLTLIDKITSDLAIPCIKTPERCYFFGDTTSKRDPTTYLEYIHALYDYYLKVYYMPDNKGNAGNIGIPLVINTPGWVKGTGYDVLVDMLNYMSPSHVVKICISAESKNLPAGVFWDNDAKEAATTVIEVNSARQDSFNRSVLVKKDARLLREFRIMAYFRQCFPTELNVSTIKELAHALAAHSPYEIPMSSIKIKHLHCQVPSSETYYSLNATIVGLGDSSEDSERLPQCVGLGLVRGIDTFRQMLYIITPVPVHALEKVDLLLQGFIQIPTCLLQVQGCVSPYMSENVLPTN